MQPTAPCSAATLGLIPRQEFQYLRDHNGALDRDAHALQFLVVLRHSIIHEDQRGGDVAIRRIGVVGRKLFRLLVRSGIDLDSRLLQNGSERGRLDHFHQAFFRRGEQNVEGFDMGIESPFLELGEDPLGVVFVVRQNRDGGGGRRGAACSRADSAGWEGCETCFPNCAQPGKRWRNSRQAPAFRRTSSPATTERPARRAAVLRLRA